MKIDSYYIQIYRSLGIELKPEFKFAEKRKFRFDYVVSGYPIAIEVEGGVWTQGRHTRPMGYLNDLEKYNLAATLGWYILRYSPEQFKKSPIKVVSDVKKIIELLNK